MLLKECKGGLNKWKNISYSWIRKLNGVRIVIIPELTYRFIAIFVRILADFFVKTD